MKKLYTILLIYSSILVGYILYQNYNSILDPNDISNQLLSGSSISFTGNTFSGTQISTGIFINTGVTVNTGITIEVTKTELEKFNDMKKDGFLRIFNPPPQPILTSGLSYQMKSNKLNSYLADNNFYFRNTSKLEEGYLYIKLAKPIKNFDIFLYFHDARINSAPVSGKLAKEDNLITGTGANQEFLYRLDDISIYKFYDGKKFGFNWLNDTLSYTNSIHFIGGYTTTSDGNYIKEIIITGK